jgi:hypothetical protein
VRRQRDDDELHAARLARVAAARASARPRTATMCPCSTSTRRTCTRTARTFGPTTRPAAAASRRTACRAARARATRARAARVLLRRRRHLARRAGRGRAAPLGHRRGRRAPRGPALVPPAHPREHRDPGGVGRDGRVDHARPLDEIPGIQKARERLLVHDAACRLSGRSPTGRPATRTTSRSTTSAADRHRREADQPHQRHAAAADGHAAGADRALAAPARSFLDEVFARGVPGRRLRLQEPRSDKPPVRLTQIGRDGLPMPRPESGADWPFAPPYVFMSPGYRVEALLDGSELADGDTLCVMSGRFLQRTPPDQTTGVGITLPPRRRSWRRRSNGDLVAIVNVTEGRGAADRDEDARPRGVAEESPSMMLQGGAVDGLARCEEAKAIRRRHRSAQRMLCRCCSTGGLRRLRVPRPQHQLQELRDTDREKYPYDRVLTKGDVDHWRSSPASTGTRSTSTSTRSSSARCRRDGAGSEHEEPPLRASVRALARHVPGEPRPHGRRAHRVRRSPAPSCTTATS